MFETKLGEISVSTVVSAKAVLRAKDAVGTIVPFGDKLEL